MESVTIRNGAVVAAEQYARATALARRAKGELVESVAAEGDAVNRQAICRIAGISDTSLYRWLEERSGDGDGGE